MGASVGHYHNTVKRLPNAQLVYFNGEKSRVGYTSSIYGTDNVATIIGESAGVFYGYKTAGVFATDAEAKTAGKDSYLYEEDATGARLDFKAGDMHFVDLNQDGKISEADRTIIGNPNPDIYGNIFANVDWHHFTLTLGFNYSIATTFTTISAASSKASPTSTTRPQPSTAVGATKVSRPRCHVPSMATRWATAASVTVG